MFNPEQTKAFVTYESAIGTIHDKLGDRLLQTTAQ